MVNTERENAGRIRYFVFSILGILVMAIGAVLLTMNSGNYEEAIRKNNDIQLDSLINAVDLNIDNVLTDSKRRLSYCVHLSEFQEAQRAWREEQSVDRLLEEMRKTDLADSPITRSFLAILDGKIIASTDGETGYYLLNYNYDINKAKESFVAAVGPSGGVYLALGEAGVNTEINYYVLIDLDVFFKHIEGKMDGNMHLTLVDEGCEILIHNHGEKVCVHFQSKDFQFRGINDTFYISCDKQGLFQTLSAQREDSSYSETYEYSGNDADQSYQCRMISYPTESLENPYFAIGASMNMTQALGEVEAASNGLMWTLALIFGGALILVFVLVEYARRNQESREELAVLRQKNEAADRLIKKNQELAHHQMLETIGTLTAGVAHEFNNLLTPIMSYSILSLNEIPPEETDLTDNLVAIYDSSKRAREIVAQLSALSRANPPTERRMVSLDEVVHKAKRVTDMSLPGNVDQKLELGCAEQRIEGNEVQLTQVVTNLVLNAYHAMEEKGGTLTIRTYAGEKHLYLEVCDTGVGIPKEMQQQIFEPFFTTKEGRRGTGLGLAIVAQIVEAHRGRITVESEPGEGTTIRIQLPLSEDVGLQIEEKE